MPEKDSEIITIGRGSDNRIIIDDQSVSLHHASLSLVNGRYWLKDLGSSNGTYVGGRRITESAIAIGDLVSFGLAKTKFSGIDFPVFTGDQFQVEDSKNESTRQKNLIATKSGLFLVPLVVLVLFFFVRSRGSELSTKDIARATVLVVVNDSFGEQCWSGSGALILEGRFVVTNAHVAAVSPEDGPEYADCKVITIGLSDSTGLNPSEFVGGEIAVIDIERDLAIVELDEQIESESRSSLSIRNSDVGLEMQIRVFGYPGIGGDSLTTSSGIISGLDRSSKFSYFKVSADISSGNSGGPVVDNEGKIIGIATAINRQEIDCSSGTTCYSEGNGLGLVRPISLLQPLLEKINTND